MTPEPYFGIYTRNGFAGPVSTLIRTQYTPKFLRAEGDYAPHRIDTNRVDPAEFGARSLPVPILEGEDVQVSSWRPRHPTPFAIRNVLGDELLFVVAGTARLETDFGVLDVRPGDFVLLPRAVGYRLAQVSDLDAIMVASASQWRIDPEHAPATLNPELHVDRPLAYEDPAAAPGEYEVLLRHGDGCTSLFYDCDPLATLAAGGAPAIQRFNLEHVQPIGMKAGIPPARLVNDDTTRNLIYYLGSRESGQPPIHHNADYDEIVLYTRGPGSWGSIDTPGEMIWTPKGIIHEGPVEDVPEGYVAWLLETRAPMRLTRAGKEISQLMETSRWEVHPSVMQEATAR
jgi:homogentisate 1,2-dioxygenase